MKERLLFEQTLLSFEQAEREGWTLKQLVQYILENKVMTTYDHKMTRFIDHRVFFLGYLKFEFKLEFDNEPLEVETYYDLSFKLTLVDDSGTAIQVLRNNVIFSSCYVLLFRVPEMEEEIPGLEAAVQLAIDQTLAPLDLEKRGGLLTYIQAAFNQEWSDLKKVDFDSLLMYLSLHAGKYDFKGCTASQLEDIDKSMGVPLPNFYKKFLQVVGLKHKLSSHLVSTIDGFEYNKGNEQFVFATDANDNDCALLLTLDDDPNQIIAYQWITDNPYGDSPYSTFQTFTAYIVEQIQNFETK